MAFQHAFKTAAYQTHDSRYFGLVGQAGAPIKQVTIESGAAICAWVSEHNTLALNACIFN